MSSQLRKIAPKRKLNDMSTPCSPDAANGHRDHPEVLRRYNRNEPFESGKDPGLTLYIWQDPHQPREVESDCEYDEWRGPPGSLLGSDVLARRSHNSDFASHAQGSRQELEIVPATTATATQPRYPTIQESQQELEIVPAQNSDFASDSQESPQERDIVPAEVLDFTSAAQELRKELEIVPANSSAFACADQESREEHDIVPTAISEIMAPSKPSNKKALARTHKYGRRRPTTSESQGPKYEHWSPPSITGITKDFVWQHSTDHLTKFDPNKPYHAQAVTAVRPFSTSIFYDYNGYHLCMDPNITSAREIPQLPVRLDDRLVALAYEGFSEKCRHRLWPSEFDARGLVRPGRIPLGFAAKHEYKVGDIDFDGNILQQGEEGWYYLWLGGIHCLMGKEGMDAGRFQPRDYNMLRITGFAFKRSHKAEIQAPPGMESER